MACVSVELETYCDGDCKDIEVIIYFDLQSDLLYEQVSDDGEIQGLNISFSTSYNLTCSCGDEYEYTIGSPIVTKKSGLPTWDYIGDDEEAEDDEEDSSAEDITEFVQHLSDSIDQDTDTHWNCYCKTQTVCGCGCDPLHDGW